MNITKAVITAAAPHQRALPVQSFVDRDGEPKTALRIVVDEALSAGVDDVCVVAAPGDADAYRAALGNMTKRVHFVEQPSPRGYGHALLCARDFAAGQTVLHLVGDHLSITKDARTCAQQVADVARAEDCAVSAVQATRESLLPYFGAIGGKRVAGKPRLYGIERVIEKPAPTEAEQHLLVPGLRAGFYPCFFGIHVLTPAVFDLLADELEHASGPITLSGALNRLAGQERYLAYEVSGRRYDLGAHYGALTAQLGLALNGRDREDVLAQLVELLAAH